MRPRALGTKSSKNHGYHLSIMHIWGTRSCDEKPQKFFVQAVSICDAHPMGSRARLCVIPRKRWLLLGFHRGKKAQTPNLGIFATFSSGNDGLDDANCSSR